MEQENKYYTPSIEEFHVGFECEISTLLPNPDKTRPGIKIRGVEKIKTGKLDC